MKTFSVIGSGAVGSFYGLKLLQGGADVHFLFNTQYNEVKKNGLVLDLNGQITHVPYVQAYQNAGDLPPSDVVIIALKTTMNPLLPQLLKSVLKPSSVVWVMQNGIGNEEYLEKILSGQTILTAITTIQSVQTSPGRILVTEPGVVRLSAYKGFGQACGTTQEMLEAQQDLSKGDVVVKLNDDYLFNRFKKLLWNLPFNGMSVVLGATSDRLVTEEYSKQRGFRIMKEVAAVASKLGRLISETDIRDTIAITSTTIPYKPSMMVDYEKGRPLEIEYLYKNFLDVADRAGVNCPETYRLYLELLEKTKK